MAPENQHHTGLYERAIAKITQWVRPSLHRRTEAFVAKSIDENAKDNPRFARIIAFEIRRRGDGPGITLDVAEPLFWTGIKTALAVPITVITHYVENKKFKMIGYGAALGILLNNGVELLRLIPRFTAGLQGSLEMAKDRERAIEASGIDPFTNYQAREINLTDKEPDSPFTQKVQKQSPIAPVSLAEQAEKSPPQKML